VSALVARGSPNIRPRVAIIAFGRLRGWPPGSPWPFAGRSPLPLADFRAVLVGAKEGTLAGPAPHGISDPFWALRFAFPQQRYRPSSGLFEENGTVAG
jgi:hypothetical protein